MALVEEQHQYGNLDLVMSPLDLYLSIKKLYNYTSLVGKNRNTQNLKPQYGQ